MKHDFAETLAHWQSGLIAFRHLRDKYLLY